MLRELRTRWNRKLLKNDEEWNLLMLLYDNNLVFIAENKSDLRMIKSFYSVCRRMGLKVNAGKSIDLIYCFSSQLVHYLHRGFWGHEERVR